MSHQEKVAPEKVKTYTEAVEEVTLRDGTTVTIRPIRPDDAPRLLAFFSRLSPETVYFRYLRSCKELPHQQVEHLVGLDHGMPTVLVATHMQNGEEYIVAVAQYDLIPADEPGLAEPAMVVEDRYQNHGLGTLLWKRLVGYARTRGIHTFLAAFHHNNTRITRIIRRSGLPIRSRVELGICEICVELETEPTYRDLEDLSRFRLCHENQVEEDGK